MDIKIKYEVNGKQFENKNDAERYVEGVNKEKERIEKLTKERDNRRMELERAYDNYKELLHKYNKDYCSISAYSTPKSLKDILMLFDKV